LSSIFHFLEKRIHSLLAKFGTLMQKFFFLEM